MIAKKTALLCFGLGATLLAARADAQPETGPDAKPAAAATAGAEGTDQLTLPKGRAVLNAFLEINLSSDNAFKPISISPDVWYGATDDITVGLVHSAAGSTGFIGGVGTSLCLSGSDGGCSDLYRNVGFEARYKLKTGEFVWAADGGLYVLHFSDPFQLAIKLGAVGRWHSGQLAVELQPNLFFGLTNRTPPTVMGATVATATNQEVLNLPATAIYAVTPMISVLGQLGFVLPFENTGDAYAIPLSIGGSYHVNESLDVTLAFSLPKLVGGGPGNGVDTRSLTLGGTYAF
ncbi:MAG TPA: hypothetical protein VF469_40465 [Kofleriaceae bacterium]